MMFTTGGVAVGTAGASDTRGRGGSATTPFPFDDVDMLSESLLWEARQFVSNWGTSPRCSKTEEDSLAGAC